jgi:Fe-S cluster assembly protein SufD
METQRVHYITKSSNLTYHVGKNDVWNGYFIIMGEETMDVTISCFLDGHNAHAFIHVINILIGHATVTLKTLQHHISKNAQSNVLVKTVLSGNASFVFDGTILVDSFADKTDAYQRNENLILSPGAKAISRPTLEILANDVRCTHGAATGEIPFDQVWYLKTRGLSEKQAETVYVQGFIQSALMGLKPQVSETIQRRIMDIY